MSKLLRADFARLWKTKAFWAGMAFTFGMGVTATMTKYRDMMTIKDYHPHIDNVLFSNCIFMPIVAAVFIGLFVGTEYSDGTIRNKIIVGRTRLSIYFSNFVVCMAALLMMHLANIGVIVVIGFPLVGNLEMPVSTLLFLGLLSIITLAAICALFLLMSMLIHSKASNCVAAILISLLLLVSAMMIWSSLAEPEYTDEYTVSYTDDEGENREEHVESRKNPRYLTGTKRKVYEFLWDFLPGCQMRQISTQNPEHPERLPWYSLSIIIVTTACGTVFFRRKNIK
ncbi:ABC transporter permease subunit [Roseburia hominis]